MREETEGGGIDMGGGGMGISMSEEPPTVRREAGEEEEEEEEAGGGEEEGEGSGMVEWREMRAWRMWLMFSIMVSWSTELESEGERREGFMRKCSRMYSKPFW